MHFLTFMPSETWSNLGQAAHLWSRSVTLLDSACKCGRSSFSSEKSWLDCAGCCESSSTQSLTVASLPLCQAGLSLWSCILAPCHHVYCLLGAVWSALALVHSMHLVLFVHSMDLQPFAKVLSEDLVQDVLEDLTLQSSQKGAFTNAC